MYHNWDNTLLLRKAYDRALDAVCQKWGMTRNELCVLLFLANNPDYDRATDIVERLGISKSHVSAAVRGLDLAGYLKEETDKKDRRVVHLCPQPSADRLIQDGRKAQAWYFTNIMDGVTNEEKAAFCAVLTKSVENAKRMWEEEICPL